APPLATKPSTFVRVLALALTSAGQHRADQEGRPSWRSRLDVAVGRAAALAKPLDEHGLSHAAGHAHRLDPQRAVERAQTVDQRGHDARAGHPKGVAEGYGATERIEPLLRNAELVPARNDLGRERLVDLDHVDVVDLDAGLLEQRPDGRDRTEAHDLGPDRRHRRAQDPRLRRETEALGLLV